jgi:pilus assembly protein Flp/PilA
VIARALAKAFTKRTTDLIAVSESLLKLEKGATAVEYGLLVALIAAVIVGAVALLGTQVSTAFTSISSQL